MPGLLVFALLTLVVVGDDLLTRPNYEGATSLTVYTVDTSGSLALSGAADRRALFEQRSDRVQRVAEQVGASRGLLILTNFSADATGLREITLDLSDNGIKCQTLNEQGESDSRCLAIRENRVNDFIAGDLVQFSSDTDQGGGTDVVNGGLLAGATTASASQRVPLFAPRNLVIESDFLERNCPPFALLGPSDWPTGDEALNGLTSCLAGAISIDSLESVRLFSTRQSATASIAELETAVQLFSDFCTSLGGTCSVGV